MIVYSNHAFTVTTQYNHHETHHPDIHILACWKRPYGWKSFSTSSCRSKCALAPVFISVFIFVSFSIGCDGKYQGSNMHMFLFYSSCESLVSFKTRNCVVIIKHKKEDGQSGPCRKVQLCIMVRLSIRCRNMTDFRVCLSHWAHFKLAILVFNKRREMANVL